MAGKKKVHIVHRVRIKEGDPYPEGLYNRHIIHTEVRRSYNTAPMLEIWFLKLERKP